ncbi:hypothetical protein ACFFL1_17625 [Samsonia erythrinae]|uniref:Lipoprotein n=1 Tax=Samsonia erythrinae TaxID=160434 RepID=A0A4R3VHB6_9GAMM|nr:hypothetical protein [Samsonia erythrinae]TCV03711.1 hypothetical protein EDC54_11340 [Samsonia erythrinae]
MKYNVFFVVLFLSGCVSQWERESTSAVDFNNAYSVCSADAEAKFPVKNEVATQVKTVQKYDRCTKADRCGDKKYDMVNRVVSENYSLDVNKNDRNALINTCMKSKGWGSKRVFGNPFASAF